VKKIESRKLDWETQSKVGSTNNIKHKPGGGNVKVLLLPVFSLEPHRSSCCSRSRIIIMYIFLYIYVIRKGPEPEPELHAYPVTKLEPESHQNAMHLRNTGY
jgi:hypothetical protein